MFAVRAPFQRGLSATCRQQRQRRSAQIAARVAARDAPEKLRSASDDELRGVGIPDSLPRDFCANALAEEAPAEASTSGRAGGLDLGGSLRAILLLNLGALLFGSNQVVIKTTEELLSPVALDALRFGAAALCFVPLLPRALRQPRLFLPALELGAWLTAGYTAQAFGLAQTSASHGAFTSTFTVLAVPLLVGLSGRRVAKTTWVAGVAALIGVGLLTTGGGDPSWGDAICILSAVLFGVHQWRSEAITCANDDTSSLVALQLAVLAATSIALAVPETAAFLGASSSSAEVWHAFAHLPWLEILFMGIGTTAVTLYIEMDALKEVSAPLSALIYTAEPLWGAGFAWVLLDERWGMQGWVGAALIVSACLASQLGGDVAEKIERTKAE